LHLAALSFAALLCQEEKGKLLARAADAVAAGTEDTSKNTGPSDRKGNAESSAPEVKAPLTVAGLVHHLEIVSWVAAAFSEAQRRLFDVSAITLLMHVSRASSSPDHLAVDFADPVFNGSATALTRGDDTLLDEGASSAPSSLLAHPSHLRLQLELTEATATAFASQMHYVYADAVTRYTLWQRELLLQSVADGIEATWGATMSLADIAALGADAVDVDASVGRAVISVLHGATPQLQLPPTPPPPFNNGDAVSGVPPLDLQPSSSIATAAPSPSRPRVRGDERDVMSQNDNATAATHHGDNYDDDDAGMEAAVGLLEREVETLREVLSARLTSNVWTTTTGSGSAAPSKRGGGGGAAADHHDLHNHPLRAATAAAAAQLALAGTSIGDLAAIAEGGGNSFAAAMGKVGSGDFGADSSGASIVCIDIAESP
jgi:hypothetical protein